jgi:hypothetical protein
MNPSDDSKQNITTKPLMSETLAKCRRKQGPLTCLLAVKVCYFLLGICFASMKEILRESLRKTGSMLDLLLPAWARESEWHYFVVMKSIGSKQNAPSLF